MDMDLQNWCLPVYDGTLRPTAKFHYFIKSKSLCGYYQHDNDFYKTNMLDCEVPFDPDKVCKRCLKKFLKLGG